MPDDPIKLSSMTSGLKNLPGYKTIEAIMKKAGAAWDKIKGFFGRVAKAFKSFFESVADTMEEIIDGFAKEGLGYLPKLVKKIVGASAWEVIEPLITAVASSAEKMLSLFETDPPTGVSDFFSWALKIAAKAWGLAFDSIGSLVSALRTMISRLGGIATKLVTKMVNDGMIGVKRHTYWYWMFGKHYFLAATEYKINLLGTSITFREEGMITDPRSVVGIALFEALEQMGVPSTGGYTDKHTGENSRDRWA
jgi:phage-related protein